LPPSVSLLAIPLGALPFCILVGFALLRFAQGRDRPGAIMDAILAWGVTSYLSTELLGAAGQLAFAPFLLIWLAAGGTVLFALWRTGASVRAFFRVDASLASLIVLSCVLITLFIALTAVPNNWDSQAYHLPRIEHWLQNRSLSFYPSWNVRQNEFAPLAEYLLLQTRVLARTDLYYPLIQWTSMLGCVIAVFRITAQLGGSRGQCWIASVFLVTLPIGILESTSTQNDYVEAVFLLCFVSFGLEAIERRPASLWVVLSAATAGLMTGLTKPIGFMLGVGFAAWFAVELRRGVSIGTWLQRMIAIALVAAALVAPFGTRLMRGIDATNYDSMHFSSSFGVRPTVDTLIRHVLSNLALGIAEIDKPLVRVVESATRSLGLQTWRVDTSDPIYPVYTPPDGLLVLHEDLGPNPLHTVLLVVALGCAVLAIPAASAKQSIYLIAWLVGILVFCSVIRFSMWEVRYHLPGFAAAAPIFGLSWPPRWIDTKKTAVLLVVLMLAALPALLLNQSRELVPLWRAQFPALGRDRPSYLTQTRLEQRFVNQPQMLAPYRDAIDLVIRSNASQLGLMMDRDNFEYGVWGLLRGYMRQHPMRIEAVGVPGTITWPLGPFTPDFIFRDKKPAEPPQTLEVDGRQFRLIYRSDALQFHDSEVALYERVPPR
jgi:hypothetical protein